MTSGSTREFMALHAIATHFGRPGTPTDQAWIETFFGHLKAEWPHLLTITEPAVLRAELDRLQLHWNGVRLHAGIGYVTPLDEHEGRGETIRKGPRSRTRTSLSNPNAGELSAPWARTRVGVSRFFMIGKEIGCISVA